MFDYLKNENGEIEYICICCGVRTSKKRFCDIVSAAKRCASCASEAKYQRHASKKRLALA